MNRRTGDVNPRMQLQCKTLEGQLARQLSAVTGQLKYMCQVIWKGKKQRTPGRPGCCARREAQRPGRHHPHAPPRHSSRRAGAGACTQPGPPAPAGDSEAGGGARAIGDPSLKPFVSAAPAVTSVRLGPGPSTLIMGSDGLWDVVAPSVRAARGRPRAVQCPQGAPDLRRGRIAARRSWRTAEARIARKSAEQRRTARRGENWRWKAPK